MVGVSGEGEAWEGGGGEVHLSGRHHAATHAWWLNFLLLEKPCQQADKIEQGLTSFLAMEGQMIRAGKTVTQPVASEKPKTHSDGTVFGYLASACLMLKEFLPIYGVLNSTRSKVWLDA